MSDARFREAQSRRNWVSRSWVGLESSLLLGNTLDTRLKRSGISLTLVSAVALHLVSMCSMLSVGARWLVVC